MRVIAGEARRINLKTPEGKDTRPTQDRIKETLFNMIQNEVPGSVFVDLFCGAGGIGIEALSRGAAKVFFVEQAKEPLKYLEENLEKTRLATDAVIIRRDAISAIGAIRTEEADIVYLDPPYEGGYYKKALKRLSEAPYVTGRTLIIAESHVDEDFSYVEGFGLGIVREKKYKNNKHTFFRKEEAST